MKKILIYTRNGSETERQIHQEPDLLITTREVTNFEDLKQKLNEAARYDYICFNINNARYNDFYFYVLINELIAYNANVATYDSYYKEEYCFKTTLHRAYSPNFYSPTILSEQQKIARLLNENNLIELHLFESNYFVNKIKKEDSLAAFLLACYEDQESRILNLPGGMLTISRPKEINCASKLDAIDNIYNQNSSSTVARSFCLMNYIEIFLDSKLSETQEILKIRINNILKSNIIANNNILKIVKKDFCSLGRMDKVYECQNKKYRDLKKISELVDISSFAFIIAYAKLKFVLAKNENIINEVVLDDILSFSNIPFEQLPDFYNEAIRWFLNGQTFSEFQKYPARKRFLLLSLCRVADASIDNSLMDKCQIENLEDFPCNFALRNDSDFISKNTARQFSSFLEKERMDHEVFDQYLSEKSIAIIGNGPSQLGKKTGEEIDKHEIVVRFNNYEIDGYEDDYGEKCDIWAISMALNTVYRRSEIAYYKFILVVVTSNWLQPSRINILRSMQMAGIKVILINAWPSIVNTNIRLPSTGLIVLDYFYGKGQKENIHLFGFDLNQENGVCHYFSNDPSTGKKLVFHKWDNEKVYIKKLTEK